MNKLRKLGQLVIFYRNPLRLIGVLLVALLLPFIPASLAFIMLIVILAFLTLRKESVLMLRYGVRLEHVIDVLLAIIIVSFLLGTWSLATPEYLDQQTSWETMDKDKYTSTEPKASYNRNKTSSRDSHPQSDTTTSPTTTTTIIPRAGAQTNGGNIVQSHPREEINASSKADRTTIPSLANITPHTTVGTKDMQARKSFVTKPCKSTVPRRTGPTLTQSKGQTTYPPRAIISAGELSTSTIITNATDPPITRPVKVHGAPKLPKNHAAKDPAKAHEDNKRPKKEDVPKDKKEPKKEPKPETKPHEEPEKSKKTK